MNARANLHLLGQPNTFLAASELVDEVQLVQRRQQVLEDKMVHENDHADTVAKLQRETQKVADKMVDVGLGRIVAL